MEKLGSLSLMILLSTILFGPNQTRTPAVIASTCSIRSRDAELSIQRVTEQRDRVFKWIYRPACFPNYYYKQPYFEGMFLENGQPLPVMGRTCGHFNTLVVFIDTPSNRQRLLNNGSIPTAMKAKVSAGQVKAALDDLFAIYTSQLITSELLGSAVPPAIRSQAANVITFAFTVVLTNQPRTAFETGATAAGEQLGFSKYDDIVIVDDFAAAGFGVHRWPGGRVFDFNDGARPLFYGRNGTFLLYLNPLWITPGLFANELLRRNLPQLASEYLIGERTLVMVGPTTYDQTPFINPRTGENVEPLIRAYQGKIPFFLYIAGYLDLDNDGIIDCVDPVITSTPDNVDGDFLPDRLDPNLSFNHSPFLWIYSESK